LVVVDGNIVLQEGRMRTLDEHAILSELREGLPEIQRKISAADPAGRELEPILEQAYRRCLAEADPSEFDTPR
jgi:hypothetical protein